MGHAQLMILQAGLRNKSTRRTFKITFKRDSMRDVTAKYLTIGNLTDTTLVERNADAF